MQLVIAGYLLCHEQIFSDMNQSLVSDNPRKVVYSLYVGDVGLQLVTLLVLCTIF